VGYAHHAERAGCGRKVWVGKCGPVDAAEHLEVVSHPISRVWLDCSSSQPLGGRWRSSTIVRWRGPDYEDIKGAGGV